ncbi:glycoside hydrolase family protein [Streptomyces profundus]|uniref:glycoside hydrolase family protein n=1 Tax=Streptomyces profundus TaxID=2867410 RepID=UPI001D16EB37|nr:glycoside hydrolase family protein [Streptomyces sp. MA3_2.13]UED84060.1 glycoside hydrolase family protein [Streptomyces sp. MA3_2.13]
MQGSRIRSWVTAVAATLLALLPQLSPTDAATAASERKGVNLNPGAGVSEALADVGAAWYYNWASGTGEVTAPDGVEFVPMIWGAESVTDAELARAVEEGSQLLGFNEPDLGEQADLTVEQALDLWPRLEATGLRLGAPAVAFGGDTPGGWLDRFMAGAEERGLRVDFIPLHWYGSDFGPDASEHLRGYLQAVADRYGKPVWLTEYALIDFTGPSPRYPSSAEQAAFVRASTAMLEGLPFLERYAWFTLSTGTHATGLYDGATPNESGLAYRAAGTAGG